MNPENVLPFAASSRRAMARRGSPDKALSREVVEMQCPYCGAVLCLDPGVRAFPAEVLCADCRPVDSRG